MWIFTQVREHLAFICAIVVGRGRSGRDWRHLRVVKVGASAHLLYNFFAFRRQGSALDVVHELDQVRLVSPSTDTHASELSLLKRIRLVRLEYERGVVRSVASMDTSLHLRAAACCTLEEG